MVLRYSPTRRPVIGASILVCALAFACDGLVAIVQRLVTPKPLRGRHVDDATLVSEPL